MRLWLCLWLLLCLASCDNGKKELHIYSWADMFDPGVIKEFEGKCHCRVVIDSYDSNEMLYSKLRSGAKGYDLIFPTYYYEQILSKQGMLEKIDPARIPNLKNLDRSVLKPIEKSLLQYSVPFAVSYTGLGYRQDRIKDFQPSWTVYGNSRYRGRMTLLNDERETLGIALITLGFSPNTINESEIEQAADLLIKWKKNIAKFENEQYKNGIATAEFLIVQGYSSDLMQVAEENLDVAFSFPKEGSIISYDQMAIPKGAQDSDLAYEFMNFLYQPEVAAKNMKRIFERIPNKAAYPLLPEKTLKLIGIFPSQSIFEKLQPLEDVGDHILLYHKAWERVKES